MDYLLRDNLMTGSRYGNYDLGWLLHSLTVDEASGRLAVTWKGVSAVEAYLQSRYHMYRNVYFHKVVRAAEGMVKLALQRARRLMVQDRLPWPPQVITTWSRRAAGAAAVVIEDFVDLDDVSVMHCFKVWTKSDDQPLAALCNGLLHRRLYKTIDLSHLCESDALAVNVKVQDAIRHAGGDPAYDLFYDEASDSAYETFQRSARTTARTAEILVRGRGGAADAVRVALSPLPQRSIVN